MLTYTQASQIDLAAPVPQVLAAAFGGSGGAVPLWIVLLGRAAIFALALSLVAQYSVIIAATSRLPLVAGWDHLVPQWFTRLHPRFRTPTRSLYFITLCALALGVGSLYGAGHEEAFQLINGGSLASYGIYYVMFFAVPVAVVLSKKLRHLPRPGFWLVLSALSGAFITLLGVVFALQPIIYVPSKFIFGLKVGLVTLGVNLAGALLYVRGVRRKNAEEAVAVQT